MKKYDCIFLDRDGTLNADPGYISRIEDFSFFDFTILALQKMTMDGKLAISTTMKTIGTLLARCQTRQAFYRVMCIKLSCLKCLSFKI